MHRRTLLAAAGTATGFALAGCVLDLDPVQAGTLIIDNDQDRSHTVTVTVTKLGEYDRDVPPETPTPTPSPTTTDWRRDHTFEVSGGGRVRESEFVAEPGEFRVEARTGTGVSASTPLGLYPAGGDGEEVAESYIQIDIYEDGRMNANTPVDD